MVIYNKSYQNLVYFPKNFTNNKKIHHLKLYSEVTNNVFVFDIADEDSLVDYYVFELELSKIPDGEYVYTIDYEDAKGIIILVGQPKKDTIYENKNKFIIYGE